MDRLLLLLKQRTSFIITPTQYDSQDMSLMGSNHTLEQTSSQKDIEIVGCIIYFAKL
jgi:hypothetical protein